MTSRVARSPINVPQGVEITIDSHRVLIKGPKGSMEQAIPSNVTVAENDKTITISVLNEQRITNALAGTTRALIKNHIVGVSEGYESKLVLKGVGYKAQVKESQLVLSLGYSHPVNYDIPTGITIETPSQTDIIIKGCSKQKVGQTAAEIRKFRKPERYKGKGIRYADEVIILKETKKK